MLKTGSQAAESRTQESALTIEVVHFGDDAGGDGPLLSSANPHNSALFKNKNIMGILLKLSK